MRLAVPYIFKSSMRYILLFIFLFITGASYAQVEVSSGIDMSYPLLINKANTKLNYGQIGFGLRFGVSYKPTETQFFPTLNFSIGHTRLPLQQIGNNVAYLNLTYLNLILNGNYVISFENSNALYIIGGIGFSRLNRDGLGVSGNRGQTMDIHLDSTANVNKAFPAISLGMEYVYGESSNRSIYMSLGIRFEYIYFLSDRNTYYYDVTDMQRNTNSFNSSLEGHAIFPNFHITLHYMLGNELVFWHKKKSSFYL